MVMKDQRRSRGRIDGSYGNHAHRCVESRVM